MSKLRTYLFILVAGITMALFAGSMLPQSAQAAPAACYFGVLSSSSTARTEACTSSAFQSMLNVPLYNGVTLTSFKDDHCYTLAEFAVIETPATAASAPGVPSCAELATWTGTTAATPAKCYSFNEATLSTFFGWDFEPDLLTETECTPELNGYYRNGPNNDGRGGAGIDIPPGTCVVFSTGHEATSPSCSELQVAIEAANTTAVRREEEATAATVGSECDNGNDCTGFENTACVDVNDCGFVRDVIDPMVKFLIGGVGFVIVIVVIVSGIRYSASSGDPQKAAAARKMIANAALALVTYLFMYAILKWLLPKGLI